MAKWSLLDEVHVQILVASDTPRDLAERIAELDSSRRVSHALETATRELLRDALTVEEQRYFDVKVGM